MTDTSFETGVMPHFMKKILNKLSNHEHLNYDEAYETLTGITNNLINDAQATAFISAFLMRRITFEELKGFRQAMLDQCREVRLNGSESAIDIVGTGGDGKNTFNISTLACIVVAATGRKVIKHGNYGSTSVSGSSNVLEQAGYVFTHDAAILQKQLDEANLCFLHAPLFHSAMKNIAPIRRNLGIRTFFNLLGPLINPARPAYHLIGTNELAVSRMYHYLMQDSDEKYSIIHNTDGYDELTLTAACKVYGNKGEKLLFADDFGLPPNLPEALDGGSSIPEAATILTGILNNQGTAAQVNAVIANAALAIQTMDGNIPLRQAAAEAREAIESGKASSIFHKLIQIA